MDREAVMEQLQGCFLAVPTLFEDDLSLNLDGMRRLIGFLLDSGLRTGNAMLLVNGATGEFPVLTLDERKQTAEAVVDAADGRIPVIVGAQTSSTLEAIEVARHAQSIGAPAAQVSPPFYYQPTEDDVHEHMAAIAKAAPELGIVAYNTYGHGFHMSLQTLERFGDIPQVVAIKWHSTDVIEYQAMLLRFADRFCMIDNQIMPVLSRMLGARGANLHPALFWPEWGLRLWELLEGRRWEETQAEVSRVLLPFYDIYGDAFRVTAGEGHVDKLALEMVGLPGGPNRPPTRPLPPVFRERMRSYILEIGAPLGRG